MGVRISVITVCRNAQTEILRTLKSVLEQDYVDMEYLVVDGLSSDNTCNIVYEYIDKYEQRKNVRVISEADTGIYNAMNKGIANAVGEWIIFMNAGDCFADSCVLRNVEKELDMESDFVYGNTLYEENTAKYLVHSKAIHYIKKSMPFCHQSIFNRKAIIEKLLYDERYQICADYELYCRAYEEQYKFKKVDDVVSCYVIGGFSKENQIKLIEERTSIQKKYGYLKNPCLWEVGLKFRVCVGKIAKKILPKDILTLLRKIKI